MPGLTDRERVIPVVIIVLLYVAAALITNPRGEFPLNDDWAYTRTAFRFGTGSGMHVDEWSAPSLVGQGLYGGAVVRLFGTSFLALRLSTLALSCGISILLWFTLALSGVAPGTRWAAVLSWIFNPVQFCLAFTFMTEIPFLFFVSLALFFFAVYERRGWGTALAACSASLGYAFLIRQMAILFAVPVCLVLLASRQRPWRRRILDSAIAAAIFGSFVSGYDLWVRTSGGATPATQRKYELLRHLTVDQLAGNSFGILFYVSFMLLPALIAAVPHIWKVRGSLRPAVWAGTALAAAAASASGLLWFSRYAIPVYLPGKAFHSQMPFLLNVLYDTGLGPVTLDPTYYGVPETPTYPGAWRAATYVVAVSAVLLGMSVAAALAGAWRRRQADPARFAFLLAAAASVLMVAGFEIVFSHTQEGGLFDRHILTVALPALILVSLGASGPDQVRAGKNTGSKWPAYAAVSLICAVLAWFSVAATHDYLSWNRIRWDFGRNLIASGVNPLHASCGFEFNAWYNYDTFRARGNIQKVYYWWYDREDWVIVMAPQEGYRIARMQSFDSWVHLRPVSLYLLQRADSMER